MRKKAKKYVLYGCPIDKDTRYTTEGYVGALENDVVGLVDKIEDAIVYADGKADGHGTPKDWIKLLKDEYKLNVHPVYLSR